MYYTRAKQNSKLDTKSIKKHTKMKAPSILVI